MASSLSPLLQSHRQEILALGEKYGIHNIRVFGSVARGEDTRESDIDFLVQIDENRSLTEFCRFRLDLQAMLRRDCDVVSERGLHPLLQQTILSEARPL